MNITRMIIKCDVAPRAPTQILMAVSGESNLLCRAAGIAYKKSPHRHCSDRTHALGAQAGGAQTQRFSHIVSDQWPQILKFQTKVAEESSVCISVSTERVPERGCAGTLLGASAWLGSETAEGYSAKLAELNRASFQIHPHHMACDL